MSDKKPIYMTRKGLRLYPEMQADARALELMPQNQRLVVNVHAPRNASRLRAYWAMLQDVVDAIESHPTANDLHQLIKMECGYVSLIRDSAGRAYAVPSSVALDKMPEETFIKFMADAERFIAERFGIDVAELKGMQDAKNG